MRLLLSLASLVAALSACAVINGLSGAEGLVCDDASCTCPVPDESEEGAICIGPGCGCEDGFLGCDSEACQITYSDTGCAVLGCSCNPATDGDCTCETNGSCVGFSAETVVRTDLGAGCIGQCECRDDLCTCDGPSCTMETDGLLCSEDTVCLTAAGGSASGCIASEDCNNSEVCVFFERDEVGQVGHCFEETNPGGDCDNGGTPFVGAFVANTGVQADICPRPVGPRAQCVESRCVDG